MQGPEISHYRLEFSRKKDEASDLRVDKKPSVLPSTVNNKVIGNYGITFTLDFPS